MEGIGVARARSLDRIVALCEHDDHERSVREAVLAELRHAVGFDAYAWLLTDPDTEVGCAPLADVPCLPELPRLIRLKYLTTCNRWTGMAAPVATLVESTGGQHEGSQLWAELLSAYDVADVASLVFRDAFGCWGFLDLWRTGAAAPFTPSEVAYLASVVRPATDALRRAQARTFAAAAPAPTRTGPAVLVLSPQLEVRAQTAETDAYLRALVPTDADRRPIPAGAYNVAAQLLAVEAGVDHHPASARVHLGAGTWLTMGAARVETAEPSAEGDIAVTIELSSPGERRDLFSRAHGLSARESELVEHLAEGADTATVARRMFVSEHTVQDHLKSIFAKTGVRTRRTLLSRAVGR